ncbi:MAG: hypothetical protein ABIK31_06235 [candidate division WOR-3 bacterium]
MIRKLLIIIIFKISLLGSQPLQHRILIATSSDGINFQKLNTIFCDSADVPDAVIGSDGAVYVYYQGLITPWIDGIKVAISNNGIDNWQHYQVQIPNTNWPGKPCDPDVVMFGDTFRLYFTADSINDGHPETYSAISLDGINFIRESGVRFEISGQSVLDPSLLWTNDTLQYFAGGCQGGYNWHAQSIDGLNFWQLPNFNVNNLMMANGICLVSGGYRFYCFSNNYTNRNIYSIFSSNGNNWTLESGCRLTYDSTNYLEYLYVKDPAIVYKDSIYLMYYVTRKRPTDIEEISRLKINGARESVLYFVSNLLTFTCDGEFSVKIFDAMGKLRQYLLGRDLVVWDGKDNNNQNLSNGIYFGLVENKKIMYKYKFVKQ